MRVRASLVLAAIVSSRTVAADSPAPPAGSGPSDPQAALASVDRRLADLASREQSDKVDLARLEGQVARAHTLLIANARAYYKLTRAGLLPLGGGFDALVTHAMHVERAHRRVTADLRDEHDLHARAQDLVRDLQNAERDRDALTSQRTALQAARAEAEDEQRRRAAYDKAFETSTGVASDYVAVNAGLASGAAEPIAGGFASARGRLLFPVSAKAEVRAGRREGTSGPGIEISAAAGSAVRAVFAGRVAFADRYGPYGRMVILDHGEHYYTVSGNLDAIDVKIGQDVGAGDPIGTVGDDGAGPMLYFEVRRGSQAMPPGPWLGL